MRPPPKNPDATVTTRALAFGPPTAKNPSGRVDMEAPENGTIVSVDLQK
jgi:hypothetical protein